MDVEEPFEAKWLELFGQGKLTIKDVWEYWKVYVPQIFSPPVNCDCLRISFDEDLAQKYLFGPLENFMCNGESEKVYQMLRELDNPSSLCGKVFKNGDPTYGCRDCGMDPTCVLCASCFKSSSHKNHRYKISTSAGGGYCDCGDKEAWKSDVFCDDHIKGELAEPQNGGCLAKLPTDLVERIEFVYGTILAYAKELLTMQNNPLPPDLDINYNDRESPPVLLPGVADSSDLYVTLLYNDEIHTYDQVIHALEKAIECSNRDAVAYATVIDREGRSLVRCSTFQHCTAAKDTMDKPTRNIPHRPLKVQVLRACVVAHQIFASRLLSWLHKILEIAQAFRQIFSNIACKSNYELIESIFAADTQMWKSARIQWHRLFISGMLMELESKKLFARVFTKHYSKMMKDFIQDDHEHSVCVVSLAVQLFTMPTIAHMLIAEEDVLARLLTAFLSECHKNLKNDKLCLDPRGRNLNTFKRMQYILYDLKYLLSAKPEVWTNDLIRGFLHGFENLLSLLSIMQGMDSTVRQIGQHMEFEPEWECAFNLHIKLSYILPLVIDWASSDRNVFVRVFRMLLRKLGKLASEDVRRRFVKEFLNFSVSCIEYDVSFSPVSLHLPLTRLVAALMLHMDRFDLQYDSLEFDVENKPTPTELMEPVLRTQVMIAQVNAWMWRRNGFSLNSQIYFYHNVRCRQEMLDRDIMLLQEMASLIDANEFLIHLLNRHSLLPWAKGNYDHRSKFVGSQEDILKQTRVVAEEFLLLVLTIVSERYTLHIGEVTVEDCIKKEIIQLLCIENMPHSVLNKSLPENVNHETGMEKVIKDVANFKKVSNSTDAKGVFELKKEFRKNYNLFYYHYTKEEQSKSEVTQRELKKAEGEEVCCPPPVLPKFTPAFKSVIQLLQCDVLLHIMQMVFDRLEDVTTIAATETMLQIILHLIGCALNEEERHIKGDGPYFCFTVNAAVYGLLERLQSLVNLKHIKTHSTLLTWTIKRYNEVVNLYSNNKEKNEVNEKKSSVSPSTTVHKPKTDLASRRRQQIMARMANLQTKFIQSNKSLFEEAPLSNQGMEIDDSMNLSDAPLQELIAVGPNQTSQQPYDPTYTCILCHQEDRVRWDNCETAHNVMVLGAHVQRSTVLSRDRTQVKHVEDADDFDTLIMSPDLTWGVHITSCGHAMHAQCWQTYFDDVLLRERRKPHRGQNLSFDIDKNEYLCPLCESVCNTALPLLPPLNKSTSNDKVPFDDWVKNLHDLLNLKKVIKPPPPSEKDNTESEKEVVPGFSGRLPRRTRIKFIVKKSSPPTYTQFELPAISDISDVLPQMKESCEVYSNEPFDLHQKALEMVNGFGVATYHLGLGVDPDNSNCRVLQMIWASTAYTVRVLEETQRSCSRALFASVSGRLLGSVTTLVKFATYAPACSYYKMSETTSLRLLSMVLCDPSPVDLPCILQWDAFSLLVSLSMSRTGLIPGNRSIATGSTQELHVLRLCLFIHIIQILMTFDENLLYEDMEVDDIDTEDSSASTYESETVIREGEYLLSLLGTVRSLLNLPVIQANPVKVFNYVRNQCLPFLRCCGIFYHCLSEVKVPEELLSEVWVPESEFFCLLRYLGLDSHFREIFDMSSLLNLVKRWCDHPLLSTVMTKMQNRNWNTVNRLISLPYDYSELINNASQFPCPASIGDDSHTPTMCLVCGVVLCSQSYCCRMELSDGDFKRMVGACTYHAHYCGSGTGIFLRVRECRILLLSGRIKGCYIAPPYLDEYGETDQGLKRGNPLHLNKQAYDKLYHKWLSHSIPNDIARTMENSNNVMITDWFYF